VPGDFPAHAASVTLAWDPNTESDLAGYKIHYGTSSKDYQYSVDVGNFTSCDVSGLDEGKTYYFAATAYDTEYNSSDLSEEVVYTIPVLDTDTDGDGISDYDEINLYGTDHNKSDTDNDVIDDGEEIIFWGDNWRADDDQDGLINPLDSDSDNDGYTDGFEICFDSDPSDPESYPPISFPQQDFLKIGELQ
jgi:hypothetical protein